MDCNSYAEEIAEFVQTKGELELVSMKKMFQFLVNKVE